MKASLRMCKGERGVALMLVLWVIVVLSVIAATVVTTARSQTRLVETIRSRVIARYAAESGVAAVTALYEDMLRRSSTPGGQARAFANLDEQCSEWGERSLGSSRYQVAVVDLGSRVDLNRSGPAAVAGLIGQFLDEAETSALVDALGDWTDEDRRPRPFGAEARDYALAGSPFVPPNAPLLRLDDLTRIRGFSDSITALVAPYVTVRGNGRININTAAREVLAALPELGPLGADAVVSARERGMLMESVDAVRMLLTERQTGPVTFQLRNYSTTPERILVISRGWEAGRPLTHEIQAVLVPSVQEGTGSTLRVLYWSARDL